MPTATKKRSHKKKPNPMRNQLTLGVRMHQRGEDYLSVPLDGVPAIDDWLAEAFTEYGDDGLTPNEMVACDTAIRDAADELKRRKLEMKRASRFPYYKQEPTHAD